MWRSRRWLGCASVSIIAVRRRRTFDNPGRATHASARRGACLRRSWWPRRRAWHQRLQWLQPYDNLVAASPRAYTQPTRPNIHLRRFGRSIGLRQQRRKRSTIDKRVEHSQRQRPSRQIYVTAVLPHRDRPVGREHELCDAIPVEVRQDLLQLSSHPFYLRVRARLTQSIRGS